MKDAMTSRIALSRWNALLLLWVCGLAVAADPLPSWNDTAPKAAVIAFVEKITRAGGPDFVPQELRIAVFDMDGTLIPEQPVPAAVIPIVSEVKRAVAANPALAEKPAVAALLKGDVKALHDAGEQGAADIIAAATADRTVEEVAASMRRLIEAAKHPRLQRPFTELGYRPMVELLDYLRANGFSTWICSGSPVTFTRALSQPMFGIPVQQVLGSHVRTRFAERDGRSVLLYTDQLDHISDKEGKPPVIDLGIGERPLLVGGNVRSGGDIAMMRYAKDRHGPSLQLLINHDDAEREFAYAEPDGYSLREAAAHGFMVVSMKNDWARIFSEPTSR